MAAVLVAITTFGDAPRVILTKRSHALKHHPGQVAFPGGKVDAGDGSVIGTALREAREEVALPSETVEILGTLPVHTSVTRFVVTPVIGLVSRPFEPICEPGEVTEIFAPPLDFLMERSRYLVEGRMWQGSIRRYYAVPWGPYYIWGATARILRGLAERMP